MHGEAGRFDHCLEGILRVLREHPEGLGEYELLRTLEERQAPGFSVVNLRDPMGLYQAHFILFHCLYRLQQRLARDAGECLSIHCLRIALSPAETRPGNGGGLEQADPMRSYYLDLANLDEMDAVQVEALLSDFWRRFVEPDDRRRQALEVLGLEDPVDQQRIRKQYRRLAQRHHPDRGGDTVVLQRINEAMMVLSARR
ncbi:MAG: DnaJ domain-containing protein [Ectothiorhodospiraceae bacterium]|nr:DnaJ domain-containing protein [Ectothiorhodospiraceae bacterium]